MRPMQRLARLVAVSTVGSALLAVGVVMLVTPGPGLLLIFLGVCVFALEFTWAERIRNRVRDWVADRLSRRNHERLHRIGLLHAPPDAPNRDEPSGRPRRRSRAGSSPGSPSE